MKKKLLSKIKGEILNYEEAKMIKGGYVTICPTYKCTTGYNSGYEITYCNGYPQAIYTNGQAPCFI
ncbi:hypothetical protein D3C85_1733440 [compost metagenome]